VNPSPRDVVLVVAASALIGCRPSPPPPSFTPAHRTAVLEALDAKKFDAPRFLEFTADGWVVASFELRDAALANRKVSLSADALVRLHAIREALQSTGFTNYRVNIHGSAPDGGLGRRYGRLQVRGDRIEWMGPE
jgi:hypothetical protein